MNCLDCQTPKEYFDKLNETSKEELECEYKKKLFISNNIELTYNTLRSKLFLQFIKATSFFLHKTHSYTI